MRINERYHTCRGSVKIEEMTSDYCLSKKMMSDTLIKPLNVQKFQTIKDQMPMSQHTYDIAM